MTISTLTASPLLWTPTPSIAFRFFTPDLALREPLGEGPSAPKAIDLELAAWLTAAPAERPTAFQARWSTAARLGRAQCLLHEVAAAGRRPSAAALEIWAEVDREWRWIATSRSVRSMLANHAKRIGAAEPDAVARTALLGIARELLPILRLIWIATALSERGGDVEVHFEALGPWEVPDSPTTGETLAYAWYLAALRHAERAAPTSLPVGIQRAAAAHGADSDVALQVATQGIALARDEAIRKLETSDSAPWFEQQEQAWSALFNGPLPSCELSALLSLFHLRAGSIAMRDPKQLGDAVGHLVKARLLDLSNPDAAARLNFARELPDRLLKEYGAPRPRPEVAGLVDGYRIAIANAFAFLGTDVADTMIAARRRGAIRSLQQRLGPNDGAAVPAAALAALLDAIDAIDAGDADTPAPPAALFVAAVRDGAVARDPGAAALPWARIEPALEPSSLPIGDVLPRQLPAPALPTVATIAALVREHDRGKPLAKATWREWIFARRDAGYKLAAVAGVVMFVASAAHRGRVELRYRAAERDYAALTASMDAENDSVAVASGLAFLDRAVDTTDARLPDAKRWVRGALLRRVVTLTEAKRTDEAGKLLDHYQVATRP